MSQGVGGPGPVAWQRIDAVVAVALLVALTTPVLLGHPAGDDPVPAVLVLAAGASLPLAVRRLWPVPVLALVALCLVVADLFQVGFTPWGSNAGPALGLAMYTVAERSSRRSSLAALAAVAAATFTSAWIATWTGAQDANAVQTVAAAAGWLVGDAVRTRRAYRDELADRQRRAGEERTRRALAEERLQIYREVHDVISHNLSVIAVRSGVGRLLFDSQPAEARTALAEVERVSRRALGELRRLLGAVRDQDDPTPTPRLADLPRLVDEVTAAGTRTTLEQRGVPMPLPSTLELSAYRIVQEALTNVVKHAGRSAANVLLEYGEEGLHVEVTDDGNGDRSPDRAADGTGWGLVGIHERAALHGGTVETGARPGSGFRVSVRFPPVVTTGSGTKDGTATGCAGQR